MYVVKFPYTDVKGLGDMAEIRIFEYVETEKHGHLDAAREMLAEMGALNVSYLKNGKPVAENCFVSISHSKGKCTVCISDREVGIDIEKITDKDFEKTVNRTFGEKETEYFMKNRCSEVFYEIWTRKEAYSKISGDGIKDIMKGTDTFSLEGYEFKTQFHDGFVLTVCEKNI